MSRNIHSIQNAVLRVCEGEEESISDKARNPNPATNNAPPELGDEALYQSDFVAPIVITKKEAAKKIASLFRRARLDYEASKKVVQQARRLAGLEPQAKPKRLPELLTADEMRRFFEAVDKGGILQHSILMRVLFYTGARVSELAHIKRRDIDLDACTIRIEQGKGSKDRVTLFPESFKLALSAYLQAATSNVFLFESRRCERYTARRIEQLVASYGKAAGIEKRVHPHLFRHQCLTELSRAGLTDAQIQQVSGHASRKSLETYTHLGLSHVAPDYQEAMKQRVF